MHGAGRVGFALPHFGSYFHWLNYRRFKAAATRLRLLKRHRNGADKLGRLKKNKRKGVQKKELIDT